MLTFEPHSPGYDTERAAFQTNSGYRPALVVGATSAADVRAAVRLAAERNLPVAVQSTGHGLAPTGEPGVLITTHRMRELAIDPIERTARVAAGVRWGEVLDAAAPHGLVPLLGSAPHVGVPGYTVGGGLSLFGRAFGWAADRVRELEVVTADGELQRAVPGSDLYWALLGGGANLGIVTELTFELVPMPELWAGGLFFDADLIPEALRTWTEWTPTVPDTLTSSIAVIPYPDFPGVPDLLRGRRVAHIRITQAGPAADALVTPLRALGPFLDTLGPMKLTEVGTIYSDPTTPAPYYSTNRLLRDADALTTRRLLAHTPAGPHITELRHLGGALASPAPNAVGGRDAKYLATITTLRPEQATAAAHEALFAALAPWTSGGRFRNFLTDPAQARYPRRLHELKARLDPAGRFGLLPGTTTVACTTQGNHHGR
ncbi:FAD-binding oxidoreductase [Crossiella cryophila]|uniref:FAD/FMN-containing dehydrogenase n=1 Tax=Crossiella cryophila TaxID=43355 RepID=A0A7W7C7I6_9PSEU|nr:FAD-binding oxidoreductase [Crossiella cryophila]MBB4675911.1 FAD/FMN-containing dehydrogenase [Crossiella cryophila]